jgi:hypothetical protein
MKTKLMTLIICLVICNQVLAGTSRCYTMRDNDKKTLCLAQAKGQKSYCYSIKNKDEKNFCLATVGNQKSYCYSISDRDKKNACLGIL